MEYQTIEYNESGKVVHIVMNRPKRHNALSDEMNLELLDAFRRFDHDPDCWVAVLRGNGPSFCSGADVQQRQAQSTAELRLRGGPGGRLATVGDTLGLGETVNWKPVIAAVHGYALGAGFDMAMQCDLVVATPEAQFEITEAARGLGGAHVWAAAWFWGGARIANEMAIVGSRLTGTEGYRLGLVNRVVGEESLVAEATALARKVAALPPLSVRANVRMCRHFVREMTRNASIYQSGLKLYLTDDYREAVNARLEKREAGPFTAM